MNAVWILAAKELRDGLRNRWVAASVLLLAAFALLLALVGSAPVGAVRANPLEVNVVSLASLSVYLLPLIALMVAYDSLVGEFERGTMLLLLTYPVARWQVVIGKFLGHAMILGLAVGLGYGGVALAVLALGEGGAAGWQAYLTMMGSSLLLGTVFLALGYGVSVVVRERATAAGLALGLWLLFVVLYDLALLGLLLADQRQRIGQTLFASLMVINPTDAYRILNLTGAEGVAQLAGMSGVAARAGLGLWTLWGTLLLWLVAPLGFTLWRFQKREL